MTVVDVAYLQKTATELPTVFETWYKEKRALRDAISTRPIGFTGSALLSATSQTRLQQAQAPYTEWTSGKLANMIQNYDDRMIVGTLKVESAVSGDQAEQTKKENLLHACEGFIYQLDHDVAEDALASSWRWQVADQGARTGKHIGIPWVRKRKDGTAAISCDMWDPLQVAHDFRSKPKRVVHFWATSAVDAKVWLRKQRTPKQPDFAFPNGTKAEKDDDEVIIHDIWVEEPTDDDPDTYEVRRGIMIDGVSAGIHLMPFTHMPVKIRVTHATTSSYGPTAQGNQGAVRSGGRGVTDEAIRDHANTFFETLKQPQINYRVAMSTIYEGLAKALGPSILVRSEHGDVLPPEGALGANGQWAIPQGVEVEAVNKAVAQTAEAVATVVREFDKAFDAVFNPRLYGMGDKGESGYSKQESANHALVVFAEPAAGAGGFVLAAMVEIIHQLKSDPSLVIVGKRPKGWDARQFSAVRKLTAKDLPDDPMLTVEWSPNLGDEMEKYAAAVQAQAQGYPQTEILARILDETNPQELMERRADEDFKKQMDQDPQVFLRRKARYYLNEYLQALVAAKNEQDPQLKANLQTAAALAKQDYAIADAQAKMGLQPGIGSQPAAPGLGPQYGGSNTPNSPDQLAGAMGLQSSAAGGQSSTQPGQGGGKAPARPPAPALVGAGR